MDLQFFCRVFLITTLISLVCQVCSVTAGDIVHDDDLAPKKPGCENDFVLVFIFRECCFFCYYPALVSSFSQLDFA